MTDDVLTDHYHGELEYFNCTVKVDRPKARCVKIERDGQEYWVPKSVSELREGDGGLVLLVKAKFAKDKGMCG